jgi:DNA processing protein
MVSAFDVLVLSRIPNVGPNRLRSLLAHFGDSSQVFKASARDLAAIDGFSRKLASHIVRFFRGEPLSAAQRFAEKELSKVNSGDGKIMTYWDKHYPEGLKKIYDPPPFLFLRGDYIGTDPFAVAIVGTRAPSEYGIRVAEKFTRELSSLGIAIVSGLARGIDTVVHTTAIRNSGRTIAVIGSGLDIMYPPENGALAHRIAGSGAVMTEYTHGTKPDAGNFPRRNRIISGLSLGTLVVETDISGGAMITAGTALDQNREVFAIPGNINVKRSRGCNALIKESRAKLVESVDDILSELALRLRPILKKTGPPERKPPVELTLFEKSIYDTLCDHPSHIDLLAEKTGLSSADTLVNLLSMEFKGVVKQLPGKMFLKIDN